MGTYTAIGELLLNGTRCDDAALASTTAFSLRGAANVYPPASHPFALLPRPSHVCQGTSSKYHLMASLQHDGTPEAGSYRAFVHFKANDQWYAASPNCTPNLRTLPHISIFLPTRTSLFTSPPPVTFSPPRPPLLTAMHRYEVQDLHVNGVHPQLISVSESYIQVWRAADD